MPAKRALRINRFTVMAMLQAARAHRLGLSEPEAYSWGLNRAIFYAAAKKGFRGSSREAKTGEPTPSPDPRTTYALGSDFAYRVPDSPDLLFEIGGEAQTPAEFERTIASRFGGAARFRQAWEEASAIVATFDEATLRSGSEFYSAVYRPRRDDLVAKWSAEFESPRSA